MGGLLASLHLPLLSFLPHANTHRSWQEGIKQTWQPGRLCGVGFPSRVWLGSAEWAQCSLSLISHNLSGQTSTVTAVSGVSPAVRKDPVTVDHIGVSVSLYESFGSINITAFSRRPPLKLQTRGLKMSKDAFALFSTVITKCVIFKQVSDLCTSIFTQMYLLKLTIITDW